MVTTIGIDPHKATHTAVAIDDTERVLGELTVPADRDQTVRLVEWASQLDGDDSRLWAIEAAGGLGYLLPQQLIASGEPVVDVPPVLASRVRLLPDLVFTATEGGPIRYTNWRRRVWIPATNEAGLGGVCFHHLRHSHATFLIDAGIDPVRVSRRLGTLELRSPWTATRTYSTAMKRPFWKSWPAPRRTRGGPAGQPSPHSVARQ